jgi:hypothetical protein
VVLVAAAVATAAQVELLAEQAELELLGRAMLVALHGSKAVT